MAGRRGKAAPEKPEEKTRKRAGEERPKKPAKISGEKQPEKAAKDAGKTQPEKPAKIPGKKQPEKPKGKTSRKPEESKEKKEKKQRDRRELTTAQWRRIRLEYIKGKTTYRELAEKYGVSIDTIGKHASKEGWRKKKQKLDKKVEEKTLERVCDARAREFERIAQVNDRMTDILDNLLNFVSEQTPETYDDLRGVESLTKAIATVVQTKRDLYNQPNEVEKAKIESLREKSRLEREKFAEEQAEKAASRKASEETMIRVVIENSEEGEELDG